MAKSKQQVKDQRAHDKTLIERLRMENGRLKVRGDELTQDNGAKDVRLNKSENLNQMDKTR